jgi:hypothetical protein
MKSSIFNNLVDKNRLVEAKVGCFGLVDFNEESLKEFLLEYQGVG